MQNPGQLPRSHIFKGSTECEYDDVLRRSLMYCLLLNLKIIIRLNVYLKL